ncbi:hypothetical protein G9A89_011652 [Geosiphon pyriformis]|nr:hypothetical protein G9A89_011652 [Geosiphon pyriformis]
MEITQQQQIQTTLEYYQSIYTHCKQRFNISDGIEVVKKSVYQYIENCINNYFFENYNISEVRSNLYNNLVHYSHLGTENLNSKTLAIYFQKLNFNIIKHCEEKYPVQSKYFFDFESETKTSNKGKQRLKQYSRTTPNTPTLQKTTAKHLQTPEQETSVKLPLSITPFPISLQRPNHYHTQPSYLTIPEESDFQQTALSEDEIAAPRSNSFNHTIPSAQIAQNANLSDIFPFEFEANESPFLLSNAAVNEQKAITAMYTEATVEGKPIRLILDSRSAGSIITYQLMQQLKRNVDRPAQTVIVTADDMKKTPVGEINDFSFSIDGITILVKVLIMDASQYQALVKNDWLLKANANLN